MLPLHLVLWASKVDTQDMATTTTEGIITIKGSGLRGAKRAAAKAHNARVRATSRVRDAKGQFVARRFIEEINIEGGWVNCSDGTAHAHAKCGNIAGTVTVSDTQDGWACSACVIVTVSTRIASHNVAPSAGKQTCECCGQTKGMRSFPTVMVSGWRGRGRTCRKCEGARRGANRPVAAEEVGVEVEWWNAA